MASSWRGCASSFNQPLDANDEQAAEGLMGNIHRINSCQDIIYRTGDRDRDILRHVFFWDISSPEDIFQNGVRVNRSSRGRCDDSFYNLSDYFECQNETTLDIQEPSKYGFISTTVSNSWFPTEIITNRNCCMKSNTVELYRYEIYAPGGIWVGATLGDSDRRRVSRQDEVVFVLGIAPQYIRSAQLFKLSFNPGSMSTTKVERTKTEVIINGKFNPQSHPLRLLRLEDPVCDYVVEADTRAPLKTTIYNPSNNQSQNSSSSFDHTEWFPQGMANDWQTCSSALFRVNPHKNNKNNDQPSNYNSSFSDSITEWYAKGVTNLKSYVDATFRSQRTNEAYYFMKNVCGLVDYAPGTNNDKIVQGPSFIGDIFQSLKGTPFAEHRIDCAFGTQEKTQAYIFSANLSALIDYAPLTTNDRILKGPIPITKMFPFLEGTIFEDGIGAAFESTVKYEVYLFKYDQCARINYNGSGELIDIGAVARIFPSLNGSVLETDLDSAYASHVEEEGCYLFKGNIFGIFHFGPGPDRFVLAPVQIGSEGPGMASLFPHYNRGLDFISAEDSPAPIP